mgnify:CR=1 FL=1
MQDLIIQADISIKEALKQMSRGAEKCLIVVDENSALRGTLSDGDLRNAILSGKDISSSIEDLYNKNPTFFKKNQYSKERVKNIFIDNKFDIIPLVDNSSKVVDILKWSNVFGDEIAKSNNLSNVSVVIMAGGIGSRLLPFTNVLPKPLVPVRGKPIIDHIIESFEKYGCSKFYLTTNYKRKILKAYFDEDDISFDVFFINEKKPLGTAGSLKFLTKKLDKPFFVSNCDIIVKANYESIYDFHLSGKYDITLVASTKEYIIPYGTCILNKSGHLLKIDEKPEYNFLVNAGLYVLNPSILNFIPENKFYHITNLIEDLLKQNMKIGVFPIDEDEWIDVGEWAEYKKAVERL